MQLFALDLLRIPEFTDRQNSIKESNNKKTLTYQMEIEKLNEKWKEPEKLKKKLEELKCKEVKACLFDKYINILK